MRRGEAGGRRGAAWVVTVLAVVVAMALTPLVGAVAGRWAPGRVAAQAGGDLRVAYPADGATVPGADLPVVWSADDAEAVALVLDDAADVGGNAPIEDGDGVAVVSDSPGVLRDVPAGDHDLTVVALDGDGVPTGDPVTVGVTVAAPQTAAIFPGVCSAVGEDASYELGPVGFGLRGLAPGGVFPAAEALGTGQAGVAFTVPGVVGESVLDVPLQDLLDQASVISVSGDGIADLEDGASAACGEVGGVLDGDVLRVGLRQQPGSPVYGVATLVAAGDRTRVVVETATLATPAPDDIAALDEGEAPAALPVSLDQGVCTSLNRDNSTDLDPAEIPAADGDAVGVAFATRVLTSQTTLSLSVSDLFARAETVAVRAQGLDGVDDDELVACGEIGGPLVGGVARVALVERNGSGVQGMASVFASEDELTILVELFRVGGTNAAASPSAEPSAEPADTDGDGVSDDVDVCTFVADEDQADSDGDGIGDACDESPVPLADTDGDGVPDTVDNCTYDANPDQADADGDGVGDLCPVAPAPTEIPLTDSDGDGISDYYDNCTFVSNPSQADSNGDGIGDACTAAPPTATVVVPPADPDSDFDDVPDSIDNCPGTPNPDQADSNLDGVGDACSVSTDPVPTATAVG